MRSEDRPWSELDRAVPSGTRLFFLTEKEGNMNQKSEDNQGKIVKKRGYDSNTWLCHHLLPCLLCFSPILAEQLSRLASESPISSHCAVPESSPIDNHSRISAGTRSRAMTAPASSAMRACSALTTSKKFALVLEGARRRSGGAVKKAPVLVPGRRRTRGGV